MRDLTIIIPVYRGLEETQDCIGSLLKNMPDWCNLVVINDSSPDSELTEWLRIDAQSNCYNLIENEENLGFVKTVNKGMQLDENDVLLLNSDVEVADSDWLNRMRKAAYSKEKIASITPFSNNATICSFPNFCEDNELFESLDVSQIDNVFSRLAIDSELVEVPTGVGFCMYIKRDCLDDVGNFDCKTFGKGYGEENDWCQRAKNKGWGNFHQMNVFAYHKGGVSFSNESDPRKEKALELLHSLHPNYSRDVQDFIERDPAKKTRLLATLKLLKLSSKRKILIISHSLGGGVTQHVSEIISHFKQDADFFSITPSSNADSVILRFPNSIKLKLEFSISKDYELLKQVILYLQLERIHIHHTMGIPFGLFDLVKDISLKYDMTIHDYYYINGNPTLTNSKGRFVGSEPSRDTICGQRYPISMTPIKWREIHGKLLYGAERIICPSLDLANRFTKVYPHIRDNVIVAYHPDSLALSKQIEPCHKANSHRSKVLVLGALSLEKGADLLEKVAKDSSLEFHLLGYAYRPLNNVVTHGPYEETNVDALISNIGPDFIWFPALWPETYSYTLSIALRNRSYVVAPNIGAFPERLRNYRESTIYPWDIGVSECVVMWDELKSSSSSSIAICNTMSTDENEFNYDVDFEFYPSRYLSFSELGRNNSSSLDIYAILDVLCKQEEKLGNTFSEKALLIIWRIRGLPLFSHISRVIPIKYQRKLKRFLSEKPIHELFK